MIINVYASVSPESLFEAGKSAGLSEKAADYFRCAESYQLQLAVDAETGAVTDAKVVL